MLYNLLTRDSHDRDSHDRDSHDRDSHDRFYTATNNFTNGHAYAKLYGAETWSELK